MKRGKLTSKLIQQAMANFERGRTLGDGGGLMLKITSAGSASWVYRYTVRGIEKRMGLGTYPATSLTVAREKAAGAASQRARGLDPLRERREAQRRGITFEEAAREYWHAHCQSLARPSNWIAAMEGHVFPKIGKRQVVDLLPEDLISVFRPIWHRELTRKLVQSVGKVILYVATDDARVDTELAPFSTGHSSMTMEA